MRTPIFAAVALGVGLLAAPGIAYLDQLNVFSVNQRVNAGVGINIAPGATGTLSLSDGIFERSRTTKLGEWISVAYSAGNFSSNSGTWTVTSGNQVSYGYTLVGKTMTLNIKLDNTSVSGSPAQLWMAIPGGFLAAHDQQWLTPLDDNGTFTSGLAFISAGGNLFKVGRLDGATLATSTSNTFVRMHEDFEVQ